MTSRFERNFYANYVMVCPMVRCEIIQEINNGKFEPLFPIPPSGHKADWNHKKHHPEKKIPTNIYLLGGGGKHDDLFKQYLEKYGEISKKDFNDYTRELIRQRIMIEYVNV